MALCYFHFKAQQESSIQTFDHCGIPSRSPAWITIVTSGLFSLLQCRQQSESSVSSFPKGITTSAWAAVVEPEPRWGTMDLPPTLGPIYFIFMHFSAKILSNNRFLLQTHRLAPPHRLENPGSATGSNGWPATNWAKPMWLLAEMFTTTSKPKSTVSRFPYD